MQAVILAAGRGSRMGALTEATPKCLLTVAGKTLLEHKLDALPESVDEVIIIVGYLGSKVHDFIGGNYRGKRILYEEEENPTSGTAAALWLARDILKEKFLVMNGDNLYARSDMEECLKYEWAVLVKTVPHVGTGAVVTDKSGRITGILESTEHAGGKGLANTGFYLLDTRIFDYKPVPKSADSSELGLPQTMMQAAKTIHIQAVPAEFWVEIKTPDDLERASEALEQA